MTEIRTDWPCKKCGKDWKEHTVFFNPPTPEQLKVLVEGEFDVETHGMYCP